MNKSSKLAAAGVFLLVLVNLSVAFALTSGRGQTLPAGDFGLIKGARWTYKTTGVGSATTLTKEATNILKVKGRTVVELSVMFSGGSYGNYAHYDYVGTDEQGLYQYLASRLSYEPGILPNREPTPLVKLPLTKGATWAWTEIIPVQTMGNTDPDPENFRLNTKAIVESVGTKITTPAGTFNTCVVSFEASGYYTSSYRRWISPEVGVVREEVVRGKEKSIFELTSYSRASSPRPGQRGGGRSR